MKHYRQEAGMNLIANFAVLSSRRAIFDLPVCDLGWDDALVFINELLSIPVGQTSISFVNARNMVMTLRDSELPRRSRAKSAAPGWSGLDIASKVAHGSPFPASLKAADFVPALLTFMEIPRRIGLIGSTPEAIRKTAAKFRRHAPWHEFIIISDSFAETKTERRSSKRSTGNGSTYSSSERTRHLRRNGSISTSGQITPGLCLLSATCSVSWRVPTANTEACTDDENCTRL